MYFFSIQWIFYFSEQWNEDWLRTVNAFKIDVLLPIITQACPRKWNSFSGFVSRWEMLGDVGQFGNCMSSTFELYFDLLVRAFPSTPQLFLLQILWKCNFDIKYYRLVFNGSYALSCPKKKQKNEGTKQTAEHTFWRSSVEFKKTTSF